MIVLILEDKGKDSLPVGSLEQALIAVRREETGEFEGDCNNCRIKAIVRRNCIEKKPELLV